MQKQRLVLNRQPATKELIKSLTGEQIDASNMLSSNFRVFKHNKIELSPITSSEETDMRLYKTPLGVFPSVTTVLGAQENPSLEAWKKSVGESEAAKISARAASRGTRIHSYIERRLDNDPEYDKDISFIDKETLAPIWPILNCHIDNIRIQEAGLYSKHLECAGRVDLIADFYYKNKPKLSIIDFKTSTRHKEKEYISNYFMQTAAYSVMFEELTGIPITQLVIIIAVDNDSPQIFLEKRDNWISEFINIRKLFQKKYNI